MNMRSLDRNVLCGLMKYPELSLRAISEHLGMNYWTFYKIVEKFKRTGIVKEVAIPNFRILNKELFVAGYGNLTKKKMITLERVKKIDFGSAFSADIFYGFAESYRGFIFALSKNFTEIKKSLIYAERIVGLRRMVDEERMSLVMIPFKLAEFPIFFDYSKLLCSDDNKPPVHRGLPEVTKKKLNFREIVAMQELVNDPNVSTEKLSKHLDITPQAASKIRKRLYDERILIRRYIPDLRKLGYDVLVFAHWFTDPNAMEKMQNLSVENMEVDISPIIFLAYDMMEGIALAPFKSLQKSREIISFFENFGEKTGVLVQEPKILFLSLQEGVKIREHVYGALVRQLIEEVSVP
ncbi:MAG: MarR family transcriptional regulator [Euryarchaeota archaeon]|nr:MarR family transcriptional regulator [Euryarchaeota archaeon]